MLLVGTLRDAEVQRERSRARLVADLAREGDPLPLRALDARDIAELVEREVGPQSGTLARNVYRLSEGNPLLAHEAIRVLRDRPDAPDDAVPSGLQALVRDRLDLLSPACAELLATAAVIGRAFDVADLREATDFDAAQVLDLLGEAEASGVVHHDAREPHLHAFSHGLLRESLYAGMPPARRALVHARVGRALEERHAADPAPRLSELARHFAEAASAGGDTEKAVEYAWRAGDRARALFAFAEAADHYLRALRLLGMRDDAAVRRCDLLLALGFAQTRAGKGRQGRETLLEAAALARRIGDVERFARAAVGIAGHDLHTQTDREAIACLEEALDGLGPVESALRVRLLTRLTKALYYAGPRDRMAQASAEALALARRLNDPALLADALDARHFALWGPGPSDEKLAVANEIMACGRAARERELELLGHYWRFADLLEAGDLLGATTALGHHEEIAAELHQPYFFWRAKSHRVALALMQGRFDDAERLVQEASEIGAQFVSRNPALVAAIQLYVLQREREPTPDIVPGLRAMADENPAMPSFRAGLAHFLSQLGHIEEARAEFEALAAVGFETMPRDSNWFSMMGELAEVAAFLQDRPRAAELYRLLLPYAEQVVVTGFADLCEGPVTLYLGMLATTLGRWEDGAAHFEHALELCRRLGARPYIARTKYALAWMLLARDAPGDRPRARALLDEAGTLAASVGMAALGRRIAVLGESIVAAPAAPDGLLRLDGQVWAVSYAGTTAHVKDGKGMRYLAHLLASPGVERHALELVALVAGNASGSIGAREIADEGLSVRLGEDAGPLLDERAKQEYRRRLAELRAEGEDADRCRDPGRGARARAEIDAIEGALAGAYGLGGRASRAGSAAERARVSVTKAIRQAIAQIERAHPGLGEHLRATVRTGRFFVAEGSEGPPPASGQAGLTERGHGG
jgi:tetratricopeptide (TPR) repeat protein